MRLPARTLTALMSIALLIQSGCTPTQPFYLGETGELNYYLDRATDVAYPDVNTAQLAETTQAMEPITVLNPETASFEELTLEDVTSIALQNTKVIRGYGTPGLQNNIVSPGIDSLTINPASAGTSFNVAVVESEPGFLRQPGQQSSPSLIASNTSLETQQGVEAALAEFDAQYRGSVFFEKLDQARNTVGGNSNFQPVVQFQQETLQIENEISKKTAYGTQYFFRSITDRVQNNNPPGLQPLTSFWTQSLEAELRQPLMRGRGALVNRMPVVIARIQSDQELANLETQLQNMVTNVEIRYWNLYLAYRTFETYQSATALAAGYRERMQDALELGERDLSDEAPLREIYFFFKSQMERSFSELVDAENDLRYLMGWSPTDGSLIRPADAPSQARVEVDWHQAKLETLARRPELRQERWEIKKKEMQLAYARNSLLPEVNATALYRWLGSGDFLMGTNRNGVPFPNQGSRAVEELTGGDYQEAQFGLEFNSSIGFRQELANVRNAQVKLAREVARLEDTELDAVRELTNVKRAIDANFQLTQTNLDRWMSLREWAGVVGDKVEANEADTFQLSEASRRIIDAQIAYYQTLVEYNKSIALYHRRKGTILEYSGIQFGEGPWPGKAYWDAEGHARRRSASTEINYGWTRPWVMSKGNVVESTDGAMMGGMPSGMMSSEPYYMGETILEGSTIINGPIQGTPTPVGPRQIGPVPDQTLPVPSVDTDTTQAPSRSSVNSIASRTNSTSPARTTGPGLSDPNPVANSTSQQRTATRDSAVRPAAAEMPITQPRPANQRPPVAVRDGSPRRPMRRSGQASIDDLLQGGASSGTGAKTEATIKRQ